MATSDRGLTVIELLIALAIGAVVLAGAYGFFVASSQSYVRQNGIIQMQGDARAAMDFLVRELRHICNPAHCGDPVVSTTVMANDTIRFDRVEDTGYSSGGNAASTLNDTRKTWTAGQFAPSAPFTASSTPDAYYTLRIVAGTGINQSRNITGNAATQLTLDGTWGVTPDATSRYLITRTKEFSRTAAAENILRYRVGPNGSRDPLAENITQQAFWPNGSTIAIEVTARTRTLDPNTGNPREYALRETVQRRN
jgi:prepilin-type N-terminal cleavage/methylation domain-containing protein